jgi:uncharacterized RDD family membrane protein YckC
MAEPSQSRKPEVSQEREPSSVPERIIAAGAKTGIDGIRRVAGTAGVDRAIEDAVEDAVVRALESPATDRAIRQALASASTERRANEVLESEVVGRIIDRAIQNALKSPETERRVNEILDSALVDRVWERILASDEAQKLVERIAQAPEVRSALARQGVGLLDDVGRGIADVTRRIDDGLERFSRRVRRRPQRTQETILAGPASRLLAVGLDIAILNGLAFVASALGANFLSGVIGTADALLIALGAAAWTAAGVTYLLVFWVLAGQTPGMRFLGLQLRTGGEERLRLGQAIRRLSGLILSILPLGLGFLPILTDERRRGWHDRMAGTEVFFENLDRSAPWSGGFSQRNVHTPATE